MSFIDRLQPGSFTEYARWTSAGRPDADTLAEAKALAAQGRIQIRQRKEWDDLVYEARPCHARG